MNEKSVPTEAEIAEFMVLKLATELIQSKVPGENYTSPPRDEQTGKPVSKARILSVFRWILQETKGFSIPIEVRFKPDDIPALATAFGSVLGSALTNRIYALKLAGLQVPDFSEGAHSGYYYIVFSNLSNLEGTRGGHGLSNEGIKIINIRGEAQTLEEHTVALSDIPE